MSDDIERRLKDFPRRFPRPNEDTTRRFERRLRARLKTGRPRRRAATLGAALFAALATGAVFGHWATAATAVEAATFRSVDLTLICTTAGFAGFHDVDISAQPKGYYDLPAILRVGTGTIDGGDNLARVEARGVSSARGGVYIHRTRCSMTRARIPLSRSGLPAPATTWQRSVECQVSPRVVVRLRATLTQPGPWQVFGRRRELRGIRRDVATAAVAVRTWPARKPLSFAMLDARGNTRIWDSYDCTRKPG